MKENNERKKKYDESNETFVYYNIYLLTQINF